MRQTSFPFRQISVQHKNVPSPNTVGENINESVSWEANSCLSNE
jgi:hypothetical protein